MSQTKQGSQILSENPRWKSNLFTKEIETSPSTSVTLWSSKENRIFSMVMVEDISRLVGQYIDKEQDVRHGNAFQELLNAGLVIELLELVRLAYFQNCA